MQQANFWKGSNTGIHSQLAAKGETGTGTISLPTVKVEPVFGERWSPIPTKIPTGLGPACPWQVFSDCQNRQHDYFSATQHCHCPAISGLQCCELNVKPTRMDLYLASLCLPASPQWLHVREGNETSGFRCFKGTGLFPANRKEQRLVHNGKISFWRKPCGFNWSFGKARHESRAYNPTFSWKSAICTPQLLFTHRPHTKHCHQTKQDTQQGLV